MGIRKRLRKNRTQKKGMPPGSLVYIGDEKTEKVTVTAFEFDDQEINEYQDISMEKLREVFHSEKVTWINVDGVHNVQLVDEISKMIGLHPLTTEDILNTEHRPKIDFFEDHLLAIVKMLDLAPDSTELDIEQVGFILTENTVITFQEKHGDLFDPVRLQLKESKGRIRKAGADFLFYSLMDVIFDQYLIIMDEMDDRIAELEGMIMENPDNHSLQDINEYKNTILQLKKTVWPVREVVNKLINRKVSYIKEDISFYLQDIHDHIVQANDMVETSRGQLYGLLDVYYSSLSMKMNEIMKVLTIVSTIFIPLTFIAGIYGMNFTNMPELDWKWSYPTVWIVMIIITGMMLVYFKRKNWF
ncbi:magnesium/cobalt transporter CorA [Pseudalkalibacillus hwajinpoensis]|uniref:Magnesium transport protein CorA n=1 Tax=Guptibacillus hwajinpoensis TaxID=208199 RepID=A0A4U1MN02_9BACL|nr:magnesium/cobalt transporter CorA [Pseudalkalibacillus hwajinpoensis]TKD71840.1 magnesium/cobalt transporter CorA [Pseudalkalibacillus hwajinpoensis]